MQYTGWGNCVLIFFLYRWKLSCVGIENFIWDDPIGYAARKKSSHNTTPFLGWDWAASPLITLRDGQLVCRYHMNGVPAPSPSAARTIQVQLAPEKLAHRQRSSSFSDWPFDEK